MQACHTVLSKEVIDGLPKANHKPPSYQARRAKKSGGCTQYFIVFSIDI